MAASNADADTRRVEMILQQIDALPTLSSIAMRVLQLTCDETSDGKEVARVVTADPALAAKVLKIVRCSERGRGLNVTSVERAVLLLGFDALRSAVLSVQVFEALDGAGRRGDRSSGGERAVFDRVMFWQHSLAVAVLCERLAGAGVLREINKGDAFTAGLLHDLGTLALHVVLPAAFDRACEYAEQNGMTIDQAARRIIGLDTHTAGRRLAEHWRLPHALGDVLWLNGQRYESLPDLPHKRMIALVTLADVLARHQCLAPAGHGSRGEEIDDACAPLQLSPVAVRQQTLDLHRDVAARCESLGMSVEPAPAMMVRALSRANEQIGRINTRLHQQAAQAQRHVQTLQAITRFHESAAPGGSVVAVMGKVVESAATVLGAGFFAMLYQARADDHWQFIQFSPDGRALRGDVIHPHGAAASPADEDAREPGGFAATAMEDLADTTQVSVHVMAMLPWVADYIVDACDIRKVRLLPLRCGWGVNAVLLHDGNLPGYGSIREQHEHLDALGRTWAAAIAAAAQHEGAKRLGERLAESNRALMDAQHELTRRKAMASLGEIAAGAAHEMNNPLCIISGRSQLLASTLSDESTRMMAQQIVEQSHRLSDMITSLRRFTEPLQPVLRPTDIAWLLDAAVQQVREERRVRSGCRNMPTVQVVVAQALDTTIMVDPEQMQQVFVELIRNAAESGGCTRIECRVEVESGGGRLRVEVTDDGAGLTPHALMHAFDPFFSAKPAGRQPGLGLAHVRRIVEAHGGQVTLENARDRGGHGATATVRLSRQPQLHAVAA